MQNQQLQLRIHGMSATAASQARANKQQLRTHEHQLQSLRLEKETAETTETVGTADPETDGPAKSLCAADGR